ncbi:MAG: helix-turn-helix domain-containing protein [Nanopusillaceae archaeon]
MLDLKEVAKILNVSYHTVYRLIAEGRLGAHKIRGAWRVSHKDLENFLRENHSLYVKHQSFQPKKRFRLRVIKKNL